MLFFIDFHIMSKLSNNMKKTENIFNLSQKVDWLKFLTDTNNVKLTVFFISALARFVLKVSTKSIKGIHEIHQRYPQNPSKVSTKSIKGIHEIHQRYPRNPSKVSTKSIKSIHEIHQKYPRNPPVKRNSRIDNTLIYHVFQSSESIFLIELMVSS